MKIFISPSGRMRMRNNKVALFSTGATAPSEPPSGTGATTLTMVDIDKDQRLYQRTAGGFFDVPVGGTSDGTAPVQARAVDTYTGQVVVDWTTIATPASGAFSGYLRCPARVPPCRLEIRDAINTNVTKVGVNRFYVGAHWIIWGQSNAVNWPGGVYDYPLGGKGALEFAGGAFRRIGFILDTYAPNKLHSSYSTVNTFPGGSATFQANASRGDGFVYVANILSEAIGCAVCLTVSATGGQPLSYWAPGATGWNNLTAALAAIGGDAEGAVLYQGEADAANAATTKDGYRAMLATRQDQFHAATGRTASNFKFCVVGLGATNGNGGYVSSIDKVRTAQAEFCNSTPGVFLFSANHDCVTSDGVHVNGMSFSHLGAAGGRTLASLYGSGPSGAGPRIVGASRSGAVITLSVQHAGGTALLDGGGGTGTSLTGFRVFLASDTSKTTPLAIASTAITGANAIQVSLASDPGAPVVIDYAMTPAPHSPDQSNTQTDPAWASAVYDNVALVNQVRGCILQPCAPLTVN